MTQDKYFREELAFLKEQGKEFTEIHPQLSRFLHGRTTDPDVERLLEGFAFLTARLREKVEDEFPELTHSIINMLWPNYLRPIPSMSVVAFEPDKSVSEKQLIPRNTQLDSKPVFGTACHFNTCRDVALYPMQCQGVHAEHTREATTIQISLRMLGDMTVGDAKLDTVRFYLGGDKYSSQTLYLWLHHYLQKMTIEVQGVEFAMPADAFSTVGFSSDQALLPYPKNVYDGYRILQEYLSFPEAFHFFDVKGFAKALPKAVSGDETLSMGVDEAVSIKLTCTNRLLPLELGVGDICVATDSSPPFATFKNITVPSQSLRPVLDGSLLWTLISNLSLNYLSLLSKDALSCVLRAYDFRALVDRQAERVARMRLDGIVKIESKPVDKILRGLPVRGLQSTLYVDQAGFGSEGDLFLFGTVLSHFFALYASINSFHELVVVNISNQEKYSWGTQSGMQPLI
ncbi:type VI secretion system baseplate subunit TssF [Vibrio cholerae]|nr:type VI secretion system baseplate subunit TssF [Vibrio cholerae]